MKATKQVGKNGTIVIPKEVREALGIEEGDLVVIDVEKVKKDEG